MDPKMSRDPADISGLLKRNGQRLKTILRNNRLRELERVGVPRFMGFVHRRTVEELTPTLIEIVDDEDRAVRENGASLLAELGPIQAAPIWLRLIDSSSEELRSRAGLGLKRLERVDRTLLAPLIDAFSNRDHSVRLYAAETLFRLEHVEAVTTDALLRALRSLHDKKDVDVAETVAWLLERNAKGQLSGLVERLGGEDFAVRVAVLKASYLAGSIGTQGASQAAKLSADPVAAVRWWATLLSAKLDLASVKTRIEQLVTVLEQGHSPEVRRAALRLLAHAEGDAASYVPRILAKRSSLGGVADDVPIEAFGQGAVPHVRAAAAAGSIKPHEALVWLGKLGVVDALFLADQAIAGGASHSVAESYALFGEEGLRLARLALEDPKQVALHAATIRGMRYAPRLGLQLLREQMANGTPEARRAAAVLAARSEIRDLIPDLTRQLAGSPTRVRIASAAALIRLGEPSAALKVLMNHVEQERDLVYLEVIETEAQVPELLADALEGLADPARCLAAVQTMPLLVAKTSEKEREDVAAALENVAGFWSPLRYTATRAAARLRRPSIQDPFPTLRDAPFA